ncbi:hypothetical protein ASC80_16910 [Afipia sp. Root123D2]|uniref:hypothetical protein n=1 Tax=Afipia sp. Root123D2 TaxID=1736436 RepID=UPI0006F84F5B|nr:hypothetical protein [Afipia sp. Root123D2]KQW19120.1 hypothetical protein ASC80_16910 [Afipia sp. Root123D2]
MPLQNRVTPFGEIVAIAQRGLFTGNRGIIHDPATRTLLTKRWTTKAWIVCTCEYKGRRRKVMGGRSWTELFFLDEATALAAGHRPCFFCRYKDATAFRDAWARGNGIDPPNASAMDDVLHGERLAHRVKQLHPLPRPIDDLPDGAIIADGGRAYLIAGGRAHRWTPDGYRIAEVPTAPMLVTPPSTLNAIAAGYRPVLHPTASKVH